jgi:hypothetical protein
LATSIGAVVDRRALVKRKPACQTSSSRKSCAHLFGEQSTRPQRPVADNGMLKALGSSTVTRTRVKNARLFLIPGSEDTRGHGTVGMAKLRKQQLQELRETTPRRAM